MAMTTTREHLARQLYNRYGFGRREARSFVDDFFSEILAALESGGKVKLAGFGAFRLRTKASRPGRNPKAGTMVPVSARRVVLFHSSPGLRALVQRSQKMRRKPAVSHTDAATPAVLA